MRANYQSDTPVCFKLTNETNNSLTDSFSNKSTTYHFTVHGKDLLSLVCQWTHYGGHETICAVHIVTHVNLSIG